MKDIEKDKFWEFMSHFTKQLKEMIIPMDANIEENSWFCVWKYREYIINVIQEHYTAEEFYVFEELLNALYWILKKKIKPFFHVNEIKDKCIKFYKKDPKIKKHLGTWPGEYSSHSNSYLQFNEQKNVYYFLKKLNRLSITTMNIMTDRNDFELYYYNPNNIKEYKKEYKTYYHLNYAFPNANPLFKNNNSKEIKLKKIKKMYFEKTDKFWKQIII